MGVTYQTSNRVRRKVMTAPLTAPVASEEPMAAVTPTRPARSSRWLPATLAVAAAAIAVLATRGF